MKKAVIITLLATGLFWPVGAEARRGRQITFGHTLPSLTDVGVVSTILSPDGNRLVFDRMYFIVFDDAVMDGYVTFTIHFDGTSLQERTQPFPWGSNYFTDISWDGSVLVFNSTGDYLGTNPFNSPQIYRINWDGTGLTQLTFITANTPIITNDASLIAFRSNADFLGTNPEGDVEIFTVTFDGTIFTQITDNNYSNGALLGSSDFSTLVYVGLPESDRELFVSDSTGSFETRLTFNDDADVLTSVAGNGSLIAFKRNGPSAGSPAKLFTILPNGTGETQLTFGPGAATGILNGDGSTMLKVEAPGDLPTYSDIFVGPSDGSNFVQINPALHGLMASQYFGAADLDDSGTRAVFSMTNTSSTPSNERSIDGYELFTYDDTIGDTPAGTNVVVPIDYDASITFSNVTSAGRTDALISQAGLLPDGGADFGNPDLHYEYWTDAVYSGNVEVCFDYGNRFTHDMVRVLKRQGDSWANVTTTLDTTNNIICGEVNTLGEFAVLQPMDNPNSHPPNPNSHFYGDADGDTLITGVDVNQANAYILSKPYTVDTLQPANPTDDWNTMDVDSDRILDAQDINQMNAFILSKPVTINSLPWILENDDGAVWGISPGGNPSGVAIPFQINLKSTHPTEGLSGRAGLSVIAEINDSSPGSGSLSGRDCNPNPGPTGPRDQANVSDDQCAIAVTITDWDDLGPDLGLTESGGYGFAITGNGDGDLILDFRIEANPAFDIPAVSLTLSVSF